MGALQQASVSWKVVPGKGADQGARAADGGQPVREAAQSEKVAAFMGLVASYGRVLGLYPTWHERLQRHREQLESLLNEALPAGSRPLHVDAVQGRLLLGDDPVALPSGVLDSLLAGMRGRGIRSLCLNPGLDGQEVHGLALLLRMPVRELVQRGGVAGYLADNFLPHVTLEMDDWAGTRSEETAEEEDEAARAEPAGGGTEAHDETITEGTLVREDGIEAGIEGDSDPHGPDADPAGDQAGREQEADTEPEVPPAAARTEEDQEYEAPATVVPDLMRRRIEEQLKAQIRGHDFEPNAAETACGLLAASANGEEYQARRELLFRAVTRNWFSRRSLRESLCRLAVDPMQTSFEDPAELALELGAATGDEALLDAALKGLHLHPTTVRRVTDRIVGRKDAYDLLFCLARADLPVYAREEILQAILRTAREQPGTFKDWVSEHRRAFLHTRTFGRLLELDPSLIAPVAREILRDRRGAERSVVVRALSEMGSEAALRLLVLGMRHGDEERDPEMIAALGDFKQPLALSMLREVIHRCNTTRMSDPEAEAALHALRRMGGDGYDCLWEISQERTWGLPAYRLGLRRLANELLQGRSGGAKG